MSQGKRNDICPTIMFVLCRGLKCVYRLGRECRRHNQNVSIWACVEDTRHCLGLGVAKTKFLYREQPCEHEREIAGGRAIFHFQFILPITLISFAHHAIKKKLRKLPSWQRKQSSSVPTAAASAVVASTALAATNGSASRRDQTISMQGGTGNQLTLCYARKLYE